MAATADSTPKSAGEALPLAETHAPRGAPRPSTRGRWRAAVLIGVHALAALHIWHWLATGRSVTPLEPSESGETLVTGAVNAGFVFFALLILSTLVLGRFFCGWACHLVALQDLCAWMLKKLGLKPRPLRSRLLVFVPLLAAVEMFVLPSLLPALSGSEQHASQWQGLSVELTTETYWARFPGLWIALLTFLVDGFLIVWWLGAKGFCTYGCPYGAVFGLADRVAPGRIRVTDACEGCGHCTATCTSNVRVHEEVAAYGMVVDPGCMKCLDCVSVCPKDALYFGFGPRRGPAVKQAAARRPTRHYDLSWPEELAAAAIFAGSLFATRNLYGVVPFLLAIGLSVLVAITAIGAWRLLRSRAFRYQQVELRREGRFTAAGATALGIATATIALVIHSGMVQYHDRAGTRELAAARELPPGSPARGARVSAGLEHLQRADALGLVETAALKNRLSQALGSQGDYDAAREEALRALELESEMLSPRLLLADIALISGRPADAVEPLGEILEREPAHPGAAARLSKVIGADVELLEAHVLLARALWAAGDEENARRGLDWVLERAPDHPGAQALREQLEVSATQ